MVASGLAIGLADIPPPRGKVRPESEAYRAIQKRNEVQVGYVRFTVRKRWGKKVVPPLLTCRFQLLCGRLCRLQCCSSSGRVNRAQTIKCRRRRWLLTVCACVRETKRGADSLSTETYKSARCCRNQTICGWQPRSCASRRTLLLGELSVAGERLEDRVRSG